MVRERLYLFSSGKLSRQQNTLRFDGHHAPRPVFLPVEQIREILVFGELDLNKRLLEFLSKKGILLHFFNRYGWYVGSFVPRDHLSSGLVLLRQAEHFLNPEWRLLLARTFVEGALQNMRQVLLGYSRRGENVGEAIQKMEAMDVAGADRVDRLMAVEGSAREIYWTAVDQMLQGTGFAMKKRTRRPPGNEVNALISYGNGLLYASVLSEIFRTHLDPRIGYLHETNFRRYTLHLDMAEIFKPVLVDRLVLSLIRKGQIKKKHFRGVKGGIYLNDTGKKIFVEAWEKALRRTLHHPRLKRPVSYRRLIRLELYKLEKHLVEGVVYRPFRLRG
ncbi:MAG: type I-B CRISPR-associated endonuclease Cas1b [Candidatus Hydrothermae bacterium]|nr:type I-B CRISPR-associated endonuclease Cas1b [Candidatus Hydrothermae bacterium]